MKGTPRGSTHRTSFIDYVSEVYNSRTAGQTTPKEGNLSVRGHSISSSSVASGSSLARDLSVRSENVQSNRVLGGRPLRRDATKSARLAAGQFNYFCKLLFFTVIVQLRIFLKSTPQRSHSIPIFGAIFARIYFIPCVFITKIIFWNLLENFIFLRN